MHQQVGIGIWPLSVSTDRIGVTAMRCATLLDALAAAGHPVDRAGGGRALDRLRAKVPMLILDGDGLDRCRRGDDAFDALI